MDTYDDRLRRWMLYRVKRGKLAPENFDEQARARGWLTDRRGSPDNDFRWSLLMALVWIVRRTLPAVDEVRPLLSQYRASWVKNRFGGFDKVDPIKAPRAIRNSADDPAQFDAAEEELFAALGASTCDVEVHALLHGEPVVIPKHELTFMRFDRSGQSDAISRGGEYRYDPERQRALQRTAYINARKLGEPEELVPPPRYFLQATVPSSFVLGNWGTTREARPRAFPANKQLVAETEQEHARLVEIYEAKTGKRGEYPKLYTAALAVARRHPELKVKEESLAKRIVRAHRTHGTKHITRRDPS
jgi:hypothetical protein